MTVLPVRFPTTKVVDYFRKNYKRRAERMMAELALVELVRLKEMSASSAASLVGASLADFLKLLATRGVPYFTEQPRPTKTLVSRYRSSQR